MWSCRCNQKEIIEEEIYEPKDIDGLTTITENMEHTCKFEDKHNLANQVMQGINQAEIQKVVDMKGKQNREKKKRKRMVFSSVESKW